MQYVAFLRGIGPGNPNMRNHKFIEVFQDLGFKNVRTVISTGNVIFESNSKDIKAMEAKIEAAWPKKLGFTSTTIIRSSEQLQKLIDANPFKGMVHGPGSYLLVTFFKNPTKINFKLPYKPEGRTYELLEVIDNTLFTTTDNTVVKTTDLMGWLEKQFGKEISSRTWNTVHRIITKLKG